MKIYIGKNKRKAKETTFEDLLAHVLKSNDFKIEQGAFSDESASWVEIIQRNKDAQIVIDFVFDGDKLESVKVFESKIITIIDEENMKQII